MDTAPYAVLEEAGVRLLAPDRPGMGGSPRNRNMAVKDAARQAEAIANYFGYDQFAVVGRSGGTPHAVAVATLCPDRVTAAALLVPMGPPEKMDADYLARAFQQAGLDRMTPHELSSSRLRAFADNGNDIFEIIGTRKFSAGDAEILERRRDELAEMYAEALKPVSAGGSGSAGWGDEIERLMTRKPWDLPFDRAECPILIFAATGDGFTPPEQAKVLAEQFSTDQCRLYLAQDVGHFGGMEIKPAVYAWATGQIDRTEIEWNPPGHQPGTPIITDIAKWRSLRDIEGGNSRPHESIPDR